MAVDPTLTGTEIANLQGVATRIGYLNVVPNTVIVAGTISSTPTYPTTQFDISVTSGTIGNVTTGMTLVVAGKGTYRIRKPPSGSTLYIAETSEGDPGRVPIDIRPNAILSGDVVTVYNRFDLFSVAPRIDYPGSGVSATIYEDYDLAYTSFNTTPPALVNVTINSHRGHWAGVFDANQTYATLVFNALPSLWPTSSSVSSYAWTIPGAWTVTSGSSITQTFTARATAGFFIVKLVVTENNGKTSESSRCVWVNDFSTLSPFYIYQIKSDSRDRTGRRMTLAFNDNTTASIPDGAMVHFWEQTTWNGTDVPTATKSFTGWVMSKSSSARDGLKNDEITIEGPTAILGRLKGYSQYIERNASPTTWQQEVGSIGTIHYAIWYMLAQRAGNLLRLFDYTPYSMSSTDGRMSVFDVKAGSLLSQIQDLAKAKSLNFGADSTGSFFALRHPSLVSYGSRGVLVVTRAYIDASMYASCNIIQDFMVKVGRVRGEAFTSDGSTNIPLLSDAPGKAIGQGSSETMLGSQIVESQTDLNELTGNYYAQMNNPYPSVRLRIPFNYDVIEPAQMPLIQVTVPAAFRADGVAWVKNCSPLSISKTVSEKGSADIEIEAEAETTGEFGITVPVPVSQTNSFQNGGLPPGARSRPNPPRSSGYGKANSISPSQVQWLLATIDGYVARYNGSSYASISPNSTIRGQLGTCIKMIANPFNYRQLIIFGVNGFAYCDDATKATPTWTFASPGFSSGSNWSQNFDFTVGAQGFSPASVFSGTPGSYTAGTGWVNGDFSNPANNNYRGVYINRSISSSVITGISFIYDITVGGGTDYVNPNDALEIGYMGNKLLFITCGSMATGNNQLAAWTGSVSGSGSVYISCFSSYNVGSATYAGAVRVKSLTMNGTGNNPFGGGGGSSAIGLADIQGSINRKNWFCWLSYVGSTLYFNYTVDFFKTAKQVSVAAYSPNCTYGIAVSPYGNGSNCVVYVTAGDPAGADCKVYKSTNWGQTFSATAQAILAHGGAINVPFSALGGGANGAANYVAVKGTSTNLDFVAINGTTNTVVAGTTIYPQTSQALNSYTLDGGYLTLAGKAGNFYYSTNGGVAWVAATTIPGTTPTVYGINGWPTNSQFVLAFGTNVLAWSSNKGTTWTDAWSGYNTFRSSGFGGGGATIVTAFGDLSGSYSRPVTQ